jgi:uncharacterized protein with NRDE domain
MCLILLAWRADPEYPLVFAGNRDEVYDRRSAPIDFWGDEPSIFGGRDMEKGGTWLGISLSGRIAAVTNYRERPRAQGSHRSRGELAARFLREADAPRAYLAQITGRKAEYGPFSVIVGDAAGLWYYSNRGREPRELAPGVHGLSNHLIDTPWPKVALGRQRLAQLLGSGERRLASGSFEILLDRTPAPDAQLPDTGVGLERERELSSMFIAGERYGTRASTVVLIRRDGAVLFIERSFGPGGAPLGVVEKRFALSGTAIQPPINADQRR